MKVGQKKAKRLGVEDRVHVYKRDSTKDEFPDTYDLAFGFEVAHHVPDKPALFGHISRHLNERGQVCMADFVSRTGFAIEYDDISSYFPTTEEWVELFTGSGLLATHCVDISREMANFFTDPNFDANVDELARRGKSDAIHSLKSYDRLGHLHAEGLALYVLLTAEKRSDLSLEELRQGNRRVLEEPVPYSEVSVPHGCYELEWVESEPRPGLKTNGQSRRWLVFADRKGLGAALVRRLEAMGERAVTATWGDAYARPAADRFVVNPLDRGGFDQLLRESAAGGPFTGVVHAWSVDAPDNGSLDLPSLRQAQVRGCASVIHLVQALEAAEGLVKPRVLLVTEQAQPAGDGPVQVAQAPLFGVAKGIWMENPELRGLTVDVPEGPVEAQAQRRARGARRAGRGDARRVSRGQAARPEAGSTAASAARTSPGPGRRHLPGHGRDRRARDGGGPLARRPGCPAPGADQPEGRRRASARGDRRAGEAGGRGQGRLRGRHRRERHAGPRGRGGPLDADAARRDPRRRPVRGVRAAAIRAGSGSTRSWTSRWPGRSSSTR